MSPAAALAALAALVVAAVSAGVVLVVARKAPIHPSAAAVPITPGVQSTRYTDAQDEIRQFAQGWLARENIPGLSLAVAVDGAIVWSEAFGWEDVDSRLPATPRTRFRLGALSKPLTALAAARLVEQGRLDLDAPVQRYAPAYPKKPWTLTTRQLMGDVSGVERLQGDNNDAMPGERCDSLDEAVALFANSPLRFEPGTQHRYSIYGWVLASKVLEGAAGQSLRRVMADQVFGPLEMERTSTEESENPDDRSQPNYSCLAGAGAFVSTPTDLVRAGNAMLKPGFLKAETIALMQTPTRLASGAETTYALGWTVRTLAIAGRTVRVVSHRGSPRGGAASLLVVPDLGLSIAAAIDVSSDTGIEPFTLQIAESFAKTSTATASP